MSVIAPPRSVPTLDADVAGLNSAHQYAFAAAVGLTAALWFLALSGWLGVRPGSVITTRQNVLFSSDTSVWIDRMEGAVTPPQQLVHPLQTPFWRGPCRALYHLLLATSLPSEYAAVLAARLLVAIVDGIGVGFLAFLALHNEIKISHCVLLFTMYLLFTSNSTAALPEHFGISNALLTIAFVVPLLTASVRIRTTVLSALVVLCGGTTITNAVFPVASLVHYSFKSMRAKVTLLLAAIAVFAGGMLFLYLKSYSIHSFISHYLNLRLLTDPVSGATYYVFALIGPVIGPIPRVLRLPGWDMVSYEPAHFPVHLTYYSWIQAFGVVAWIVLLSTCVLKGLQEDRTRLAVCLLLAWILFNATLHNIWGDEFILYSPHWSWALMGLVVLGARRLSRAFVATTVFPILISQILALLAIKSALQTIVR